MAVNDLMFRGYYALHDMKTPMIYAGVGVLVNITLNLILISSMAHEGLALATSMAAMVNSILLITGFKRKGKDLNFLESPKKYGKIILAAFASVGVSKLLHILLVMNIWMPRMLYLGIAVFVAVGLYWVLLKALKIEEIDLIKGVFKRT